MCIRDSFRTIKNEAELKNVLDRAKEKLTGRNRGSKKDKGLEIKIESGRVPIPNPLGSVKMGGSTRSQGGKREFFSFSSKKWPSTTKGKNGPKKLPELSPSRNSFVVQREHVQLSEEMKNNIILNSPKGIPNTIMTPKSEVSAGSAQCCVCFDKPADSVYLECGHGGLCFDCAVDIWKSTNECYLCRKEIQQVLQLDLQALEGKIVKVKATAKLTTVFETHREAINH
eukprot:TRINITY_DN12442_c0_g1_i1.p1 TRINITY_DN12442_c0_g1~~TRINITY_DN12442_c0_g1_i1.p1  ORF type:complete len:227 (-),score=39.45 TRINITY_DN12442_c0_g1_i1:124-804(-)